MILRLRHKESQCRATVIKSADGKWKVIYYVGDERLAWDEVASEAEAYAEVGNFFNQGRELWPNG